MLLDLVAKHTDEQCEEIAVLIYKIFRQKKFLRHVWLQYIRERIKSGEYYLSKDKDAVILFRVYKQQYRQNGVLIPKGALIIKQIASMTPSAGKKLADEFEQIHGKTVMYATIRDDNEKTISLCHYFGFEQVSEKKLGKSYVSHIYRRNPRT